MTEIIVAFDDNNLAEIESFLTKVDPGMCKIKIGSALFTKFGSKVIDLIHQYGFDIELSIKSHCNT